MKSRISIYYLNIRYWEQAPIIYKYMVLRIYIITDYCIAVMGLRIEYILFIINKSMPL